MLAVAASENSVCDWGMMAEKAQENDGNKHANRMTPNRDVYKYELAGYEYSLSRTVARCAVRIEEKFIEPFAYLFRTTPQNGCGADFMGKMLPQIIRWWGLAALHHLLWLRRQNMMRVIDESDKGEISELVYAVKQFVFEFHEEFHELSHELPAKMFEELESVTDIFYDRYFCKHPDEDDLRMMSTVMQQTLKLRILSDVLLAFRSMRAVSDKMRAETR
jgi:hypothetical protein